MTTARFVVSSFVLLLAGPLFAAQHVYIGDLGSDFALIAWGDTTKGGNSIGRDSTPIGSAQVRIGDRTLPVSDHNWLLVSDLKPDTEYNYEVVVDGKRIGGSRLRTYPTQADKLCFFVIGDYGSGRALQYRIAEAMQSEFDKRRGSDNPPRFILSMGDNIYGEVSVFSGVKNTGKDDRDWEDKFFKPYQGVINQIPFHPVLGNHDGNETENRDDLTAYLDNFFFPGNNPSRYYEFSYANLVDFFALDSTKNTMSGGPSPAYAADSAQTAWLRQHLAASKAPWKIPYFHHPPFNAGPLHPSAVTVLRHWVDMFVSSGVKVVFSGHEHNFQFTEVSADTFNIRFIVSGAGGELRPADVRSGMAQSHTAGAAAQAHFCVVEIDGKSMKVTPISFQPMAVRDANNNAVAMPITVALP